MPPAIMESNAAARITSLCTELYTLEIDKSEREQQPAHALH